MADICASLLEASVNAWRHCASFPRLGPLGLSIALAPRVVTREGTATVGRRKLPIFPSPSLYLYSAWDLGRPVSNLSPGALARGDH
jgi:hypothetical protein